MSNLDEVGTKDNWRCWLCDQPVDPDASVNSDLGPSVDTYAAAKAKKGAAAAERLAHRSCNTMKGKISPVVPWPKDLLVVDPSPIFETVERLRKKGGREIIAHNEEVKRTGNGTILEERPTDTSEDLARNRYRTFKEQTYDALLSLKQIFHYHFINAQLPLDAVQGNILHELEYQSSLELDPRTYDVLRGLQKLQTSPTMHAVT